MVVKIFVAQVIFRQTVVFYSNNTEIMNYAIPPSLIGVFLFLKKVLYFLHMLCRAVYSSVVQKVNLLGGVKKLRKHISG